MRSFRPLLKDTGGTTAVEYSLLAAILGIALFLALQNYYGLMNDMFTGIANAFVSATG